MEDLTEVQKVYAIEQFMRDLYVFFEHNPQDVETRVLCECEKCNMVRLTMATQYAIDTNLSFYTVWKQGIPVEHVLSNLKESQEAVRKLREQSQAVIDTIFGNGEE